MVTYKFPTENRGGAGVGGARTVPTGSPSALKAVELPEHGEMSEHRCAQVLHARLGYPASFMAHLCLQDANLSSPQNSWDKAMPCLRVTDLRSIAAVGESAFSQTLGA